MPNSKQVKFLKTWALSTFHFRLGQVTAKHPWHLPHTAAATPRGCDANERSVS